jgi:group I intron endonuclease
MKISGIYEIVNKVNDKRYYGSSVNIKSRFQSHKKELRKGIHSNGHLQFSWNKYGDYNFDFIVVEKVEPDKLLLMEQKYLDKCKECPDLFYNISYNAVATMRGIKHSIKHREKLKLVHTGKHHSEETKNKMSISHKGIKKSEETKRKIKENHARPMLGKHLSEGHKQKIREYHLKKKHQISSDLTTGLEPNPTAGANPFGPLL